jgi:hypothetical protein
MKTWHPPGHWNTEQRAAHARSLAFLRTIVEQSDRMEFPYPDASIPNVLIQGMSRRWYCIEINIHYADEELGGFGSIEEVVWGLHVTAGVWKKDVVNESQHSVSICIGPRNEGKLLPVGDQIAALALSLQNDKTTAMRVPLLAQFIVSPRAALKDVYQFSEEGVIMDDDMFIVDETDLYEDEDDTEIRREMREFSILFETLNDIQWHEEQLALDRWFTDHDQNVRIEENNVPWHHDDQRIWELEDNLRKGRR